MQKLLLALPLLSVACSYPRFYADKTIEQQLPLAAASQLSCTTHNGNIEVTGEPGLDHIELRADIRVRGHTQEEADDRLGLVSVGHKIDGDTVKIFREYDRKEFRINSPTFTFTLRVPERLAMQLLTHNGNVQVSGTRGALTAESHNGDIQGSVRHQRARLETHNGEIDVQIAASGDLDARIESHNGGIEIAVPEDAAGWIEASTHNGSISGPDGVEDTESARSRFRGRLGPAATEGVLRIETHNGSISVRRADGAKPN
ncbi:MAG: DUF4097 domain-containing protein [Planctomycetota bacterium]